MLFAEFAERHPLVVLISVGAAVASAAVGATEYFNRKQIALLEQKQESTIESVTADYTKQVSELTSRMTSVERILEGEEKYVFDLTEVILPASQFLRVKDRYQWYGNNDIGVDVSLGGWRYDETSRLLLLLMSPLSHAAPAQLPVEASRFGTLPSESLGGNLSVLDYADYVDSLEETVGRELAQLEIFSDHPTFSAIANVLRSFREIPVYTWHDTDVYVFKTKGQQKTLEIPFVSYVGVERVTLDQFAGQLQLGMQLGKEIFEPLVKSLEKEMEAKVELPSESIKQIVNLDAVEDFELYVDGLAKGLDNSDLATWFVLDRLMQKLQMSLVGTATLGSEIRFSIRSFQKVLNTVYFSTQTIFPELAERGDGSREDVVLDEEIFFVGRGKDGLVIQVAVPSVGSPSENYAFVHRWFSGITIPVETSF